MYLVDVDDFYETNHRLDLIDEIKFRLPDFKATMFTVIGRCSLAWLRFVQEQYPWLDMVPHGLVHSTARECEAWDYLTSIHYLNFADGLGITRGFKAPGWQISDAMYQALQVKGYWVADQEYNNHRRPAGLRAYLLDSPDKLHFHVQNVCGNGLEESLDKILSLDNARGFGFVKDVV